MKSVIFSIVIPIFNVEKYLDQCLSSVQNQNEAPEFEVILVNDGSTDNSEAIAKQYCVKNENFHLISQSNQGLSAARNVGIQNCKGKYIAFLDSDDYWSEDALKKLSVEVESYELDIVFFDAHSFNDIVTASVFNPPDYSRTKNLNAEIKSGQQFMIEESDNQCTIESATLLCVRSSFLQQNGISFIEGIIHEDVLFHYQILIRAKRVKYISEQLYHRRIREGSIMAQAIGVKNIESYELILTELIKLYESTRLNPIKLKILNIYKLSIRACYTNKTEKAKLNSIVKRIESNLFESNIRYASIWLKWVSHVFYTIKYRE